MLAEEEGIRIDRDVAAAIADDPAFLRSAAYSAYAYSLLERIRGDEGVLMRWLFGERSRGILKDRRSRVSNSRLTALSTLRANSLERLKGAHEPTDDCQLTFDGSAQEAICCEN